MTSIDGDLQHFAMPTLAEMADELHKWQALLCHCFLYLCTLALSSRGLQKQPLFFDLLVGDEFLFSSVSSNSEPFKTGLPLFKAPAIGTTGGSAEGKSSNSNRGSINSGLWPQTYHNSVKV